MKSQTIFFMLLAPLILISILYSLYAISIPTANAIAIQKEVQTTQIIPNETGSAIKIFFCPRDNCEQELAKVIKNAKEVKCAFFDLDLPEVMSALASTNYGLVMDIQNTKNVNLSFKTNEGFQLMHNKFCVTDDNTITTGSFNPTENCAYKNNNNLVILQSQTLANNYRTEFDELHSGTFGKGEKTNTTKVYLNNILIENYFCPEDNCEEQVIRTLQSANQSIYFMTYSFTSDDIGNTLVNLNKTGVLVRGVFEKLQAGEWSEYEKLNSNNINVKIDKNKYLLHHKVFIIDEQTVITGSFNPTANANERNDENILIIHDKNIASQYMNEFSYVWNYDPNNTAEKTIVISEVYYDTSGKDAEEEFIELYNPTQNEIDLNYWRTETSASSSPIKYKTVQPKQTIILERSKNDFTFSLPNKGGTLILRNREGLIADQISWNKTITGNSLQLSEGKFITAEPTKGIVE